MKSFLSYLFVVEGILLVAGFLYFDGLIAAYDQRQQERTQQVQAPQQWQTGYTYVSYQEPAEEPPRPETLQPMARLFLAFLLGVIVVSKLGILSYLDRPFHTFSDFLRGMSRTV